MIDCWLNQVVEHSKDKLSINHKSVNQFCSLVPVKMYLQLFVVILAAASSLAKYNSPIATRLSGGFETSIRRFPHAVFIIKTSSWWTYVFWWNYGCGGTLIDARWVVTVASCIHDTTEMRFMYVGIGTEYIHGPLSGGGMFKMPVKKLIVHPHFRVNDARAANLYNVGLIRLNGKVNTTIIRRAYLNPIDTHDLLNKTLYAASWGATRPNEEYNRQIKAEKYYPTKNSQCKNFFDSWTYDYSLNFCGNFHSWRLPCHGDPGAGLAFSSDPNGYVWHLAGMLLWHNGSDCDKFHLAIPYQVVRIKKFIPWIEETIKKD